VDYNIHIHRFKDKLSEIFDLGRKQSQPKYIIGDFPVCIPIRGSTYIDGMNQVSVRNSSMHAEQEDDGKEI
jgi:hypothetical protein